MDKADSRQLDRYRQLARDVVSANPNNRIRYACVSGNGIDRNITHSFSDFDTDLADYFLAAAEAGLIKIVHRHG